MVNVEDSSLKGVNTLAISQIPVGQCDAVPHRYSFASKRRDHIAGLKFLKKPINHDGQPNVTVMVRLRSYHAAMKNIGSAEVQDVGRWLNNRCENPHLSFRRRELARLYFRRL
ncbi:DDE-type integrase/transposase/recombinase [Sneathiella litorea]|uniref:DDE-type integrase/transposase/recombinase n=1 Tax=Sneathiella litorea TaxID=2606216 RepID=A0A6L8W8A6_9PROT|nr:DDE-type integrase/transposase/recombinase [Sneathiella litorea]